MEEIQGIKQESTKEEDMNDVPTSVTPNVGELLLIKRSLHVTKALRKKSKGNKSLIQSALVEARFAV